MILTRVGRSHRKGLHSGRKTARLSYFARGSIEKALSSKNTRQAKIKREIAELLIKDDECSLILLQTNHDSSNIFANYIRSGEIENAKPLTAADSNIVNAVRECEEFV